MVQKKHVDFDNADEAIKYARDIGIHYPQFKNMPLDHVNNVINAIQTLPEDCRPAAVANGKETAMMTGLPIKRKADQWWGVTYDFNGGQLVGLNTGKFKTFEKLTSAKRKNNAEYFEKTGRYWSFNEDGAATAYHEMGHCYANVRGLPNGWAEISKEWAETSKCDLLKSPDEAFAEAWAAYHMGNTKLPENIANIIKGLK